MSYGEAVLAEPPRDTESVLQVQAEGRLLLRRLAWGSSSPRVKHSQSVFQEPLGERDPAAVGRLSSLPCPQPAERRPKPSLRRRQDSGRNQAEAQACSHDRWPRATLPARFMPANNPSPSLPLTPPCLALSCPATANGEAGSAWPRPAPARPSPALGSASSNHWLAGTAPAVPPTRGVTFALVSAGPCPAATGCPIGGAVGAWPARRSQWARRGL